MLALGYLSIVFGNYALSYLHVKVSLILTGAPLSKFFLPKVHFSNSQGSVRKIAFMFPTQSSFEAPEFTFSQYDRRQKRMFSSSPTLWALLPYLRLSLEGSSENNEQYIFQNMNNSVFNNITYRLTTKQSSSFWVIVVCL